jgi:hypothetical protein
MTALHSHISAPHNNRSQYNLRSQTDRPPRTVTRAPLYRETDVDAEPWHHMAHTYEWVVEQEYMTIDKRGRKTEQWILEQQIFLETSDRRPMQGPAAERKMWEEVAYAYEIEAERWMRHEEEIRRRAAERERARKRIVQEEVRKIEARIRYKQEVEKRKAAEVRAKAYTELRERERRDRARVEKATVDAWNDYEARWGTLASTSSKSLTFSSIPWPVISPPMKAEDITSAAIAQFLFSSLHSPGQTRKDRIRSAQLRWHPDRFRRLMGRVTDNDKILVEEAAGTVARCLNDLRVKLT